ncbi:MAG: Protein FecR [Variovorax sp.]|nr:MAG: Protein FecR [Variovorax sp.]
MKTVGDARPLSTPRLQKQAWVWLRLLHSGEVKPWDAQAFQRWLAASPAHQAAFTEAKLRWQVLEQASTGLARAPAGSAVIAARHPRRRAFLGAAMGVAAVAGVAVVYPPAGLWPAPDEWGADDRTATGEQRTLALEGRVSVTLNTRTTIRRQADGIDLLSGEVAVDLPDERRPFIVAAGAGRSQGASGHFEVRHLAQRVCVSCIDGSVRVAHPGGTRLLQARQQVVYDARSIGASVAIEPANVSAWRGGELVFRQALLADVLDEIDRYRPGRIVLMNAAARTRPVSGTFFIASLDEAITQLQHTFDLRARALPGGVLILS